MLYLILGILCSAGVALVMRLSIPSVKNNITMLAMGYLSCTLLGLFHTLTGQPALHGGGMSTALGLGVLSGFLLLFGFIYMQRNIRVNGVVLSGVFARLGVLVPTAVSILCFGERPGLLQLLGFAMALGAILLISFEQDSGKARSKTALILLLLGCGFADAMSKFYDELGTVELREIYLLVSFLAAFGFSVLVVLYRRQGIALPDVGWGFLLGIPNYYSVRFMVKALGEIPAVVCYPTASVATLVLITLIGVLLFHETLSRRQKLAMGIILGALVFLNL